MATETERGRRKVSFYADAELWEQFVARCQEEDLSASQVMRRLMREWLEEQRQPELFR
jgi:hypothetical protein